MTKCALLRRKPPHFFYIYPTKHPERNKKKGSKAYFLHFAKPSIFVFLQPYGRKGGNFQFSAATEKRNSPRTFKGTRGETPIKTYYSGKTYFNASLTGVPTHPLGICIWSRAETVAAMSVMRTARVVSP